MARDPLLRRAVIEVLLVVLLSFISATAVVQAAPFLSETTTLPRPTMDKKTLFYNNARFQRWMIKGVAETVQALLVDADVSTIPDTGIYDSQKTVVLQHPDCPYGNESVLWFAHDMIPLEDDPALVYVIEPGGLSNGNAHYIKQFLRAFFQKPPRASDYPIRDLESDTRFAVLHKPGVLIPLKGDYVKHLATPMYMRDAHAYLKREFPRAKVVFLGFSIGGLCTFKGWRALNKQALGMMNEKPEFPDAAQSIPCTREEDAGGILATSAGTAACCPPLLGDACVVLDFPIDPLGLFRSWERNKVWRVDIFIAFVYYFLFGRGATPNKIAVPLPSFRDVWRIVWRGAYQQERLERRRASLLEQRVRGSPRSSSTATEGTREVGCTRGSGWSNGIGVIITP